MSTAGGEDIAVGEDWGERQGDSVKLRATGGSGVSLTAGGDLHGERVSLGMSALTASDGLSCSKSAEKDGSGHMGMAVSDSGTGEVLSCVEGAGSPSGWVLSEDTSLTGEKQREAFAASLS